MKTQAKIQRVLHWLKKTLNLKGFRKYWKIKSALKRAVESMKPLKVLVF